MILEHFTDNDHTYLEHNSKMVHNQEDIKN